MIITSKNNEKIKFYRKLNQKKYRDKENLFLVFGKNICMEAINNNSIVDIFSTEEYPNSILVSKEIIKSISPSKTVYPMVGICKKTNKKFKENKNILILDDIQNPDNCGAILRSALAFGFENVYFSKNSVDLYNEKTIRASQGSFFYLYTKRMDLEKLIPKLKKEGYQILGTSSHESNIDKSNFKKGKVALILGNEGKGINKNIYPLIDNFINIKINKIESLNVSIAASIIMYEINKL